MEDIKKLNTTDLINFIINNYHVTLRKLLIDMDNILLLIKKELEIS
jgi:iron-sulfur cluster repair protein YtfE (RIC family)